jgi:hypothetical protein
VQGSGFGEVPGALVEDVGDVFGAEGLELQSIFDGAACRFFPVYFAEGDDFADVDGGVKAAGFELPVVFVGMRGEPQQVHQMLLLAGLALLPEQLALVVGDEAVLMAVIPPGMFGDELVLVVDDQPLGIDPQGDRKSRFKKVN